jgi:hypothetical protein
MHILRASKPADENSWIAALAPFWNQCYKCQSTKSLQISAGWQKGPYEYSVEIKAKSHKWSGNRRALKLEHQWMILASMTGQKHILNWLSPTNSVEGDFQTNQSSKAKTTIHKMEQFFCFFFFFFSCFGGCRTTFIAASKTAFTFCCVFELHSMYEAAPIAFLSSSPCTSTICHYNAGRAGHNILSWEWLCSKHGKSLKHTNLQALLPGRQQNRLSIYS